MERISVQSSRILSVGYDEPTETLEVEFTDRSVYEYSNVPEAVYNELMNSTSIGSFFGRAVAHTYPYSKVG